MSELYDKNVNIAKSVKPKPGNIILAGTTPTDQKRRVLITYTEDNRVVCECPGERWGFEEQSTCSAIIYPHWSPTKALSIEEIYYKIKLTKHSMKSILLDIEDVGQHVVYSTDTKYKETHYLFFNNGAFRLGTELPNDRLEVCYSVLINIAKTYKKNQLNTHV